MMPPVKERRIILLAVGGLLISLGFGLGRLSAARPSSPDQVDPDDHGPGNTSRPVVEVSLDDMPGASVYRRGGIVGLKLPDFSTVEYRADERGVGWVRYDFSMGGYKHHGTVNSNGARHGQWTLEHPDGSREVTYWFMGREVEEEELDHLMAEQPRGGW